MKKVYLIQYNTIDNPLFESRVKALGSWVKYFSDNWIVATELTSKEIYDKLTNQGTENKSIFIIELNTSNYYGRMNTQVWDFIKGNKVK